MKVHIKAFCLLLSGLLIINFICFGDLVYAASAPSVGSSVPFGSLPVEQQDPFLKAMKQFLHDFFGLFGEESFTYIDPDTGEQFVGTEAEIRNYIYSHADELGVKGVQDENGKLVKYIIDPDILFATAEAHVCYDIVSSYIEAAPDAEYIYTEHGISYSMAVELYNEALKNAGSAVLGRSGSGLFNFGLDIINGVPQNVTTITKNPVISAFDENGLSYGSISSSISDVRLDLFGAPSGTDDPYLGYYSFFCILDHKLYYPTESGFNVYSRSKTYALSGSFFTTIYANPFVYNTDTAPYHLSFGLTGVSNNLSFFTFYYNTYNSTYGRRYQNIYTYPSKLDYYPILDTNLPPAFSSDTIENHYDNFVLPKPIAFVNALDSDDKIEGSDALLSLDNAYFGWVRCPINDLFNYLSLVASQIQSDLDDPIIFDDKTITSQLTDWQKAIYVLAQQQGISFEELLSKMDLLIDSNGEITLLGLDGIEYSVSELSKKFDEIIGTVGDISGDLSKLLEYLKSLNLEGLESYIAAIEGTINDLNERDKDNSAVLGDCLGSLRDLKEVMEGLSADVSSITNAITKIEAIELDITDRIDRLDPPSSITTKFPFSLPFDVYNIFNLLSSEPVTPQFVIPLDFSSFGGEVYEINIDLSQFNYIASIVRWLLYGVFLIGLVLLTNKLIGRG